MLPACGSQESVDARAEAAVSSTQPEPADCGDLWQQVRELAVASGLPDGTARRKADDARWTCEGLDDPSPEDADIASRCPASEEQGIGEFLVYVTCADDLSTVAVTRSDVGGTPEERIEQVITAYVQGPTTSEQSNGLLGVLPGSESKNLRQIALTGDAVDVDFSREYAPGSFSSTQLTMFEEQLRLLMRQFDNVSRAQFSVEGDCERFWRPWQSGCHAIEVSAE